jgi:MFS family permease
MRAMQGIGPAFLIPNGVALLGRAYPPSPRKNLVFSIFGLTAPTGFIVGALFSSIIVTYTWWPWVYWCNAIACFLLAGITYIVIPPMDEYNPERNEKGSLDLPGCLTGVTGLILINFAFNQGPVVGWPTVYVYVLLIVGFAFMGVFCESRSRVSAYGERERLRRDASTGDVVWIESRARFPLVPLKSLSSEIALVLAAVGAGWSSFGIWVCECKGVGRLAIRFQHSSISFLDRLHLAILADHPRRLPITSDCPDGPRDLFRSLCRPHDGLPHVTRQTRDRAVDLDVRVLHRQYHRFRHPAGFDLLGS